MNVKLFKKADLIVIALITAAAGIFMFLGSRNSSNPVAEISVDGKIIQGVLQFMGSQRVGNYRATELN